MMDTMKNQVAYRMIITVMCLLFVQLSFATHFFIPRVINYSPTDYNAANQNWVIEQKKDGILYIGNNQGLLTYDGNRWTLHELPGGSGVRAIYLSEDGRIYVGTYDEFGYFVIDETGKFKYQSLSQNIDDIGEIWTIIKHDGIIYFQSFHGYYFFDGEHVKRGSVNTSPLFFFHIQGKLYAQLIDGGLGMICKDKFVPLLQREILNDNVISILPYEKHLLLITESHGIFHFYPENRILKKWNTEGDVILQDNTANRGIIMGDSIYVIGTISDGIIALDKQGKLLWHLNEDNGLINNTVLGLKADSFGNLWVALDNGISHLLVNFPVYFGRPKQDRMGMVYDMEIVDGNVYTATNQGLYKLSLEDGSSCLFYGKKEQVWYIKRLSDKEFFIGHNAGTLVWKNNHIQPILKSPGGGMVLKKVKLYGKEVLLQASYNMLSIFTQNESGEWKFSNTIKGFHSLIRALEVDDEGNVWASHLYKGLYRIRLTWNLKGVDEVQFFDRMSPLSCGNLSLNVMRLEDEVVFSDGNSFYKYSYGSFHPYDALNEVLSDIGDTYRIIKAGENSYWFLGNKEYVLVSMTKNGFSIKERMPCSIFKNPIIEYQGNAYIDKDGCSYFPLNGEIAKYQKNIELPECHKLDFISVKCYDRKEDSLVALPLQSHEEKKRIVLGAAYNNLLFQLNYPDYSGRMFDLRYKLQGYDDEWKDGDKEFDLTFSNLPYGKYKLVAKVLDNLGKEQASVSYYFEILAPFYLSTFAIILYVVLGIGLLVVTRVYYIKRLILKERLKNREIQREQERRLIEKEQVITHLKNEQLEKDLAYKSKELASTTLSVIVQNEFLENLKKEILENKEKDLLRLKQQLVRMIDGSIVNKEEWSVFQANFDLIHERFFLKLKGNYPELTVNDLRLCALLKLNLTTKDIARIQNLSIRGVETARYRLKKKLNIPDGESLVDFIVKYH